MYLYTYIEGFSFQIKLVSSPLLEKDRRSFRIFGPHQYSANFTILIIYKLFQNLTELLQYNVIQTSMLDTSNLQTNI